MSDFEVLVSIDWGASNHQAALVDSGGQCLGNRSFRHDGAGLAAMADWILARTAAAAARIGVAIEVPHGPVVEAMMERGFAVHSLNPKQLDRFRDRFSPAGAKDDKSLMVKRRLAAHKRLQDAVYHWAGIAVLRDPLCKAKYAALRARGHGHARALRSIGDRLIAVACAMLASQTEFDPDRSPRASAA